jgi:hypothetical protein
MATPLLMSKKPFVGKSLHTAESHDSPEPVSDEQDRDYDPEPPSSPGPPEIRGGTPSTRAPSKSSHAGGGERLQQLLTQLVPVPEGLVHPCVVTRSYSVEICHVVKKSAKDAEASSHIT